MRTRFLVAPLAVAATLAAQNAVVSPVGSATVEGDSNNVYPFGETTVRRYMQLHSDLGTTPLVITKLAFRVNASTGNYTGTRVHDLELYMGEGHPTSQATPNLLFDQNYVAPKTTVLPRQLVTWGPQGQSVNPGPNPFNGTMELVLATPFVYTGTLPLIWEVAYFGNTTTGTFSNFDADASTTSTAGSTITGTGCAATGATALMTHTYTINDTAGTLLMNGTITAAPPNALALMAIGFSNPALSIPDLCAPLHTDGTLVQVLGLTTPTGTYTANDPTGAIVVPNTATGITLYTQAFALDPSSPFALPLTVSNGRSATVPAPGTAQVNGVTRLWNNVGGTTAPSAYFATSTVGYGLVVEFTHL